MRQGFCVFVSGNDPSKEILDWRAAGQALPRHSVPLLIEDQGGTIASLHEYPQGYLIGGKTIEEVCEEARAVMANFA
jgi:hypothetical protein